MITLSHLTKDYGSPGAPVLALDDVSVEVRAGEIFGVVGRSGAGKSTLLRTVNLLERPDSGTVTVDGVDITSLDGPGLRTARHRIGMIFQHFNLLTNRTVQQNVEFALETIGIRGPERAARAAEVLELVGLTAHRRSYPAQLSGGQKQRVGIARALVGRPSVLLSDEATSALDPETTRSILDLLKDLNRELGLTVLLITHEMDVVKRVCDSAALMESGRIIEQGGLVELIRSPGSALARELFPLGELPPDDGSAVIDITFAGGSADRPVIAQLARAHGLDVSILGATVETIGGNQAGRTRLAVPGTRKALAAVVDDLRANGLFVEYLRGGEAA